MGGGGDKGTWGCASLQQGVPWCAQEAQRGGRLASILPHAFLRVGKDPGSCPPHPGTVPKGEMCVQAHVTHPSHPAAGGAPALPRCLSPAAPRGAGTAL